MKKIRLLVVGFLAVMLTSSAFGYSGGSGTESDPYLIDNKADLLELGATTSDYGKCFKMTFDINLSGTNFTRAVIASDTDSISSGFQGTEFTGVFDGNGKKILDLSISGGSDGDYIGLFGGVLYRGEVKDLGIGACNVSGRSFIGGLCGSNASGTISSCYSTGSVIGIDNVGGLCGFNDNGTISSCYSTVSVSGTGAVGGFCGFNHGVISFCYSTGAVSGEDNVGGFCGKTDFIIFSCYWDVETSGLSISAGGYGMTTAEMQTESTFFSWDFIDTWVMNDYPALRWQGYVLKVYNGIGSGIYSPGENIIIEYLGLDIFGFEAWTVEPIEYTNNFTDISSSITTFIMPSEDIVITAVLDCYSGGAGTESDPYQIGTKEDLLNLSDCTPHYDKHFQMISDIDLSSTNFTVAVIAPDTSLSADFQGIAFTGVFDGNGKKILNLSISGGSEADYIGLFGYIDLDGEVRNLGIVDCDVGGDCNVGGLCGDNNYGSIFSCYSTGAVSGDGPVGGFCGSNASGTISSCYSTVKVRGSDNVGGFCGRNDTGTISSCYSTGSAIGTDNVGGFCGRNDTGTISSCYSTGSVIGTDNVGGFCGYNSSETILSCLWDTELSGCSTSSGGLGMITSLFQSEDVFTFYGWDFIDTWKMGGYPVLKWQGEYKHYALVVHNGIGSGVYSSGGYIIIKSVRPDLFGFAGWTVEPVEYTDNFVNISSSTTIFVMPDTNAAITAVLDYYSGGTGSEFDPYLLASEDDLLTLSDYPPHYDKCFKMISDIDMSGTNFTRAVIASDTNSASSGFQGTVFTGIFDGNGKKILNLSISGGSNADYIGLFGYIGSGGEVKNSGMVDCNIGADCFVGGLCGFNDGIISFCYSTGLVSGEEGVGGLCGNNNQSGSIFACYSRAEVVGRSSNFCDVGGFCGRNFLGTISYCYSTGPVSGETYVGGLCGFDSALGTVVCCFWDIETSGQFMSEGGVEKTTSQMQTQSTFTDAGWNFTDTWVMDGYPVLRIFCTDYQDWLSDTGTPEDEQGYADCPSGDGIQNLLKYAIGLNPMEACSAADVMEPAVDDTNGVSIVYNKAKGTEGVELFPVWSDCLLPSNWNADGFEFSIISQTDSNVTWKATHSIIGECGYIRLKAQTDD
jgi:hypothetical protein